MVLIGTASASAGEALVFTTGMREPWTNAQATGFHDQVILALFRRIGVEAGVTYNPASARNIQLADSGVDDGLVGRVAGLEEVHRNLVRVPEPLFHNDFVAASLKGVPAVTGWPELGPRSVAYILGWVVFEQNLPKTRELTVTKDSDQLFNLLAAGRTEVILYERMQALWLARQRGLALSIHEPPLVRVPMFLYVNRKHAALVDDLDAALRAMKSDGSYGRVWQRAFAGLDARR